MTTHMPDCLKANKYTEFICVCPNRPAASEDRSAEKRALVEHCAEELQELHPITAAAARQVTETILKTAGYEPLKKELTAAKLDFQNAVIEGRRIERLLTQRAEKAEAALVEANKFLSEVAAALHPHWKEETGHTYLPEQLPEMIKRLQQQSKQNHDCWQECRGDLTKVNIILSEIDKLVGTEDSELIELPQRVAQLKKNREEASAQVSSELLNQQVCSDLALVAKILLTKIDKAHPNVDTLKAVIQRYGYE